MAKPLTQEEIEQKIHSYCRWYKVTNQPTAPLSANETSFSVMTYNLLAQTNLDGHPELYKHCDPDILPWSYRGERILRQVIGQNCDILCFQEVQEEHLREYLAPRLKEAGYSHIYKGKTGDKIEGCAIFWRKDLFNIHRWDSVEMRVPGCRVLNRDNIGLIVVLSAQENPQTKLVVATTHLLFNPKRGEVKLAQLRYLFAQIEQVAFLGTLEKDTKTPVYMPIIFCGDLNSVPFCPLYNFIVQGRLSLTGLAHGEIAGTGGGSFIQSREINVGELLPCTMLERTFIERYGLEAISSMEGALDNDFIYHLLGNFISCYTHQKRDAAEVTSYNERPVTVDYIFYQQTKLLKHIGTLGLMTLKELESIGGIPNAAVGSDHLPLAARFILKAIPSSVLQTGL